MTPAIFGLSGTQLSDAERRFFRDADPVGYILFSRNIVNRDQLRALTESLRDAAGRADILILVDQEGGRVSRLGPPEWAEYPSAGELAAGYAHAPERVTRRVELNYEALGLDLAEVGINTTCAPVLDVLTPLTHGVIGDRAFGHDPAQVARLGRACLRGLSAAGIQGVIKHIPGHGRAAIDSHEALPVVHASDSVLEQHLQPFMALADAPMAMTAHIRYDTWDSKHCATLSPTVIRDVIRARIGFDGLLISDDLDMKALAGDVPTLARAAIAAGCDVALNCWGRMPDMEGIAAALPAASAACLKRLEPIRANLRSCGDPVTIADRRAVVLAARDELTETGFAG